MTRCKETPVEVLENMALQPYEIRDGLKAPRKRINSRAKGVRGELDLRDFLRNFGYEAHRGQQHSGGAGSPDVIHDIPGIHAECKFCQGNDPYRWIQQAVRDCGDMLPVVFHRRNHKEWLVILRAEDFLRTFAPPPRGEW